MPLSHGQSAAAFNQNVATEVESGKPLKQSLAIAYSEKGEHKPAYHNNPDWTGTHARAMAAYKKEK
jgi:hypothetical protein